MTNQKLTRLEDVFRPELVIESPEEFRFCPTVDGSDIRRENHLACIQKKTVLTSEVNHKYQLVPR